MKYVIVIPDGCADQPIDALGGRTPLQAANLNRLALGGFADARFFAQRLGRTNASTHARSRAITAPKLSQAGALVITIGQDSEAPSSQRHSSVASPAEWTVRAA